MWTDRQKWPGDLLNHQMQLIGPAWSWLSIPSRRKEIKKNGMEAAMKFYQDEELMLKISSKMGGMPEAGDSS